MLVIQDNNENWVLNYMIEFIDYYYCYVAQQKEIFFAVCSLYKIMLVTLKITLANIKMNLL